MENLSLHEMHRRLGARFSSINGAQIVDGYEDVLKEYDALHDTAGVLDLSFRGRICLTGAERVRLLHGEITSAIKRSGVRQGCYAALTTAKGTLEADLNIHGLQEESLLDF